MKTIKFSGTTATAYGKPLRELKTTSGEVVEGPLPYDAQFDAFESKEEILAANAWPKDVEILKMLNDKAKQAARSAASASVVSSHPAGIIKPTLDNDVQLQLQGIYKSLMASGKHTHDKAREIAAATLGEEWDDE